METSRSGKEISTIKSPYLLLSCLSAYRLFFRFKLQNPEAKGPSFKRILDNIYESHRLTHV